MDGARDVLSWAQELELSSLSIPIRGRERLCHPRDLGFGIFFTEILTSQSGFALQSLTQKLPGI